MRIVSKVGGHSAPATRAVEFLNDDGINIGRGVSSCNITMLPDDVVRAQIGLTVQHVDLHAVPTFVIMDPATGTPRTIKRVEYADDGPDWVPIPAPPSR